MKTLHGWIFNVYASGQDMVVQVIDTEDQVYRSLDRFAPAFCVGGEPKDCRAVARFILEQPWSTKLSRAERPEPSLGHPIQVLQVEVENPNHFEAILQRARHFSPKLTYYGADVSLVQMYLTARQLSPLALCHLAVDNENRILGIESDVSVTSKIRK